MGSSSSSNAGGHQNDKKPKRGDLIQIFRNNFEHWAVYVGGGFVVHFVVDFKAGGSISTTGTAGNGIVLKEKLWNVVGKDEWKVNNSLDRKYKPRRANVIVKEAKAMVDQQLPYNLLSFNCEHFANMRRYGVVESQQVQEIGAAAVVGGAGLLALSSMASRAGANSY